MSQSRASPETSAAPIEPSATRAFRSASEGMRSARVRSGRPSSSRSTKGFGPEIGSALSLSARPHADRRAAARRALAEPRLVELVVGGRIDDAEPGLAAIQQGDRDGPIVQPVEKGSRPVDRIDVQTRSRPRRRGSSRVSSESQAAAGSVELRRILRKVSTATSASVTAIRRISTRSAPMVLSPAGRSGAPSRRLAGDLADGGQEGIEGEGGRHRGDDSLCRPQGRRGKPRPSPHTQEIARPPGPDRPTCRICGKNLLSKPAEPGPERSLNPVA